MGEVWDIPAGKKENCPVCGNKLVSIEKVIDGCACHPFIHFMMLMGYQCRECNRYFPLGEFLRLEEKEARKKARADFTRNYWKEARAVFKIPYLFLIIVGFMFLARSFWAGITVGVVIAFLIPLLTCGFKSFIRRRK